MRDDGSLPNEVPRLLHDPMLNSEQHQISQLLSQEEELITEEAALNINI